jgi:hypothetical protein
MIANIFDIFAMGLIGGLILTPFAILGAYLRKRKLDRRASTNSRARVNVMKGDGTPDDIDTMLSDAAEREGEGDWDRALSLYEAAAKKLKEDGLPNAEYASNCAQRLRTRMQAR